MKVVKKMKRRIQRRPLVSDKLALVCFQKAASELSLFGGQTFLGPGELGLLFEGFDIMSFSLSWSALGLLKLDRELFCDGLVETLLMIRGLPLVLSYCWDSSISGFLLCR